MNARFLTSALLSIFFLSLLGSSTFAQQPGEHVQPLARLIGTWRTPANQGQADEGLNSYNVFSWGVGGQLASKTYTVDEAGQEKLEYEAWQYWHPGEGTLKLLELSADGTLYEGTLSVDGDVVTYFWTAYAGERVIEFKQTVTFVGDERYDFAAFAKDGDGWREVIGATFHKDKPNSQIESGLLSRNSFSSLRAVRLPFLGLSLK